MHQDRRCLSERTTAVREVTDTSRSAVAPTGVSLIWAGTRQVIS